jgi:ubiquitin C-terminal hydrolase
LIGLSRSVFAEGCKRTCRAKKQLRISHAPKVLTIHLKRFSFLDGIPGCYGAAHGGSGAKISSHVAFDSSWDLAPYMVGEGDAPPPPHHYSLFAALVRAHPQPTP